MDINKIIIKSFDGKMSIEEERVLYQWIKESEENAKIYRDLSAMSIIHSVEFANSNFNENGDNIIAKEDSSKKKRKRPFLIYLSSSVVAAAILFFSFLILKDNQQQQLKDSFYNYEDAISTLKENIEIGEIACDTIKDINGSKILKIENISKVIKVKPSKSKPDAETDKQEDNVNYITMLVPAQTITEFIFEDGTKVTLNGGSSITYPNRFEKNKREVLLSGEAYFDVKTDSLRPFIVSAKNMITEVFGTQINVRAYADSKFASTTLFEGKVIIDDYILTPGDKITKSLGSGKISRESVDLDVMSRWMRNEFYFDNEPLVEIMAAISSWYGVNVVIEGEELQETNMTFIFKKDRNLMEMLNLLRTTINVKYKIMGKEVYLSK